MSLRCLCCLSTPGSRWASGWGRRGEVAAHRFLHHLQRWQNPNRPAMRCHFPRRRTTVGSREAGSVVRTGVHCPMALAARIVRRCGASRNMAQALAAPLFSMLFQWQWRVTSVSVPMAERPLHLVAGGVSAATGAVPRLHGTPAVAANQGRE